MQSQFHPPFQPVTGCFCFPCTCCQHKASIKQLETLLDLEVSLKRETHKHICSIYIDPLAEFGYSSRPISSLPECMSFPSAHPFLIPTFRWDTWLAPPTGSLMASPITFCNLRDPSLAPSTVSSYLSSSSLSCAPSGPGLRFMAARQHGLFPLPTHETSCSTSLACSHCIQTTPQYSAASPVNTTDTLNMARGSCQPEQSPADLE